VNGPEEGSQDVPRVLGDWVRAYGSGALGEALADADFWEGWAVGNARRLNSVTAELEEVRAERDRLAADVERLNNLVHAENGRADFNQDEAESLRDLLRAENERADKAIDREEALEEELELSHAATRELHHALSDLVDHTDETCNVLPERDRYRLAWLSARRRAARESQHAAEALALKDAEPREARRSSGN
jgi:hypothetical protein